MDFSAAPIQEGRGVLSMYPGAEAVFVRLLQWETPSL
jgi:hypothetical protein